ncbi:MAG TPA: LysR family transcriptional regulator [Burkholderiaceae bacterium]|nr:LysR family transcriptional regulator [Burkholderiaceae bacterium]
MALDVLTAMRVFTTVADVGSFARAAERLSFSRAMATRYVAQLEAHLGVRLLNRTTRRLSLTQAGNELQQRATHVLALVEEAERAAAQQASEPRGTLRINTSVIFGHHHLGEAIRSFLQRYPKMVVDLTLNDRVVDLVDEGYDLAVRIARTVDPGLVARPIARARTVACASPAYLQQHGTPRTPADLARHNCLTYTYTGLPNEWHFRRNGREQRVAVSGNLRANNGDIICEVATRGLGVILQPTFLVYKALRSGQLVRILKNWQSDELNIYAVYPNRQFLAPKVRSFIDFLLEYFGPEPYWDQDIV